jgi:drug/metabolite transporter (DMT)-like permease
MHAATSAPPSPSDVALRRRQGLIVLAIVQIFFGLFTVFSKMSMAPEGGFEPRAVAFWRIAIGALVLGCLAAARYRAKLLPQRSELLHLFALGMLGIVINQVLALEGVARISATLGGVLMTLIPVFTYGIALLAKQELLQPRRALGIGVALAGALTLMLVRGDGSGMAAGAQPVLGGILIIMNCLSYACFLILARGILARRPALWVIAWTFIMALVALPFLALGVEIIPADLDQRALTGIVLLILLCTILSYLLNTFALSRVSASTAASFIYLQPLVAAIAAWILLEERPTPAGLWPVGLLFVGLWLVIGGKRNAV